MPEESHDVDDLVTDVGTAIREFLDEPLAPSELERLKRTLYEERTVYEDVLASACSYLIIGSYGTEERGGVELDRLERVRFVLDNRHDGHHAFLLRDVPALAENFVLTFYVLALRVDYVVGVLLSGAKQRLGARASASAPVCSSTTTVATSSKSGW